MRQTQVQVVTGVHVYLGQLRKGFPLRMIASSVVVQLSLERRECQDVLQVKTIELKDTVLATCNERGDSWSDTVKARILHVHDLHVADAVYHQTCSINFHTKR